MTTQEQKESVQKTNGNRTDKRKDRRRHGKKQVQTAKIREREMTTSEQTQICKFKWSFIGMANKTHAHTHLRKSTEAKTPMLNPISC